MTVGESFLIGFKIQQIRIHLIRINFLDDRILAIPPAVKIDFATTVAAERAK